MRRATRRATEETEPELLPPPMALGAAPITFAGTRPRTRSEDPLLSRDVPRFDYDGRAPVSAIFLVLNLFALLVMVPLGISALVELPTHSSGVGIVAWLVALILLLPVLATSALAGPVRALEKLRALRRAEREATSNEERDHAVVAVICARRPLAGLQAVSFSLLGLPMLLVIDQHAHLGGGLMVLPALSLLLPLWNLAKGPWLRRARTYHRTFDARPGSEHISKRTWDGVVERYGKQPLLTEDGEKLWDPFGGCPIGALELLCTQSGREALSRAGLAAQEPEAIDTYQQTSSH